MLWICWHRRISTSSYKISTCYFILISFIKFISSFYLIKSTKLHNNDSLSFFYILSSSVYSLLFFFLFFFFLISKKTKLSTLFFVVYLEIIFYLLYIIESRNYVLTFLHSAVVNTSLQNGLLNIHPIIIYYMYANIVVLWIWLYLYSNARVPTISSSSNLYNIIQISFIGIYLGALWASQELNWGGFWSWDPVEVISIIGLLFLIKLLHNKKNFTSNKRTMYYIVVVWVVYIIIRLGVITTIHSFIRSRNITLYVTMSLFLVLLYFIFWLKDLLSESYLFIQHYYNKSIYKLSITVLFLYTYIYILYSLNFHSSYIIPASLSDMYMFIYLLTIFFFVMIYSCENRLAYSLISFYTILFAFMFNSLWPPIIIILVSCIFLNNLFSVYPSLHILLFFIYTLYFFFMCDVFIYSTKIDNYHIVYNANSSCISQGRYNFYETTFFLKKQFILSRPKSILSHINGFNIFINGLVAIYLFSKNFLFKTLFALEFVYITIAAIILTPILFIKMHYLINGSYKHSYTY